MRSVFTEFDRTFAHFDSLFRELERPRRARAPAPRSLSLNVHESEEAWTLVAQVPGLQVEDLVIEALDDVLSLKGRRSGSAPEGAKALHRERADLHFERSLRFRTPVDLDGVSAHLDRGLLTVRVPKAQVTKPRRIDVSVG